MSEFVYDWAAEKFKNTEDAILMSKTFGQLEVTMGQAIIFRFLLQGREQEMLEFAKKIEAERVAKQTKGG